MVATELRIGNLIYANWFNREFEIEKVELSNLAFIQKGIERDLFKPIPLTSEWLLKLGFGKISGIYLITTKNIFLGVGLDGSWGLYNSSYDFRVGTSYRGKSIIKYVHQLQNLYFALTEEELKIK